MVIIFHWVSSSLLDVYSLTFGGGSGQISLAEVQCSGYETSLSNCPALSVHNCDHSKDAGVRCLDGMLYIIIIIIVTLCYVFKSVINFFHRHNRMY